MNTINTILNILLVIVFFGAMIFLHELGHFVTARLCHVKVLEFALGMGPKILHRTSKKSGTIYSLRLFPIGGFCAMLGEDENDEVKDNPEAFCNRPRWQKFIVLISGAGMNLLTAFLAMCTVLCLSGTAFSNRVSGYYVPSYAGGLKIGDVITAVNETEVKTKEELDAAILALKNDMATFTVSRDGESVTLTPVGLPQYRKDGVFLRMADFVVSGEEGRETEVIHYYAPSGGAGLLVGDVVTHVNGQKTSFYTDVSWEVALAADAPCTLTVLRTDENGNTEEVTIENIVSSEEGVVMGNMDFGFEKREISGLFDLIDTAFTECVSNAKIIYRSLIQMIAGRFGTAGISGPIGIAGTIAEVASYGIEPLLQLFVIISINLGLCNLLPLPALDGGRLIFVILEMIRRKPINPKYEAYIHAAGMIILLAFTGVIAVMDVIRLIGG